MIQATATQPQRTRRTPEQQIEDLRAEIERIKHRAAQQRVKKDPALRHVNAAVRAIDHALQSTRDKATREALSEARTTLSACLTLSGAPAPRGARAALAVVVPEDMARYVAKHPGCMTEDSAAAISVETRAVSPVLKGLREEGRLRVEGMARGMRYYG